MSVGAAVYAGAGDVFAQAVAVIFQEGMKARIESLALIYRVKPRLEGVS